MTASPSTEAGSGGFGKRASAEEAEEDSKGWLLARATPRCPGRAVSLPLLSYCPFYLTRRRASTRADERRLAPGSTQSVARPYYHSFAPILRRIDEYQCVPSFTNTTTHHHARSPELLHALKERIHKPARLFLSVFLLRPMSTHCSLMALHMPPPLFDSDSTPLFNLLTDGGNALVRE